MSEAIQLGLSRTKRVIVDRERTIGFLGEESRVYATPKLLHDVESTCRTLLLEHADADQDSVGTHVELDHLAPTLMGMWAEITVTVSAAKGNSVSFEFSVRDILEDTARGRHTRFIVNRGRTAERLSSKLEKVRTMEQKEEHR